jgi:hypothetical protein
MMHFGDWNSPQAKLQAATQKLVNLRRTNMALTYGETEIIYNENGVVVIGRKYFDNAAIIVLCKEAPLDSLTIELPRNYQSGSYTKLNNGTIQCDGKQLMISGPLGYEVFTK